MSELQADQLCRALPLLTVAELEDKNEGSGIDLLRVGPDDPLRRSAADFAAHEEYVPRWWVALARRLGLGTDAEPDRWVLRLRLDRRQLYRHRIAPAEVAAAIDAAGDGSFACVASPAALAEIEIFVRFDLFLAAARDKLEQRACATAANLDFFIARDVVPHFVRTAALRGVAGVARAVTAQASASDPTAQRAGEPVVETQGPSSHLQQLLGLPGVDSTRATSNNVRELCQTLGLEAARRFLVDEITRVLSFDGSYVNTHHVPLLVDAMSSRGLLTAVRRDGIDRREVGPLAKAAFEQTVSNLVEAAVFTEHDDLAGFSARIMFGQPIQGGTGSVAVTQK